MEILFLAHRLPFPPDRGDRIRSYNILKRLAGIAAVHLACFADSEAELAHLPSLAPLLASSHVELRTRSRLASAFAGLLSGKPLSLSLFESASIQQYVDQTLATRPIDCVFAFSGQMAQFVPEDCAVRFVMDFVDVDSAKFAGYAQTALLPMRWVHAREARKLAAFEQAVARRADVSLFVSDAEAALFSARSGVGENRVIALENGVDLDFFDPVRTIAEATGAGPLIVFTGQMDYRPNIEAVTDFATLTLPLIRRAIPNACFAIVGRAPTPAVTALARLPGVTVTGEVPDVRPWLAAADVVVAPLGLARGVQNKVLEAMAMARPVVASSAAFEGIDAVAGRDLIVADGPADEAAAVLDLLGNAAKARALGKAARARMVAHYSWDARLAALPALVGTCRPMLLAAE